MSLLQPANRPHLHDMMNEIGSHLGETIVSCVRIPLSSRIACMRTASSMTDLLSPGVEAVPRRLSRENIPTPLCMRQQLS